jgi:hypothetical protein
MDKNTLSPNEAVELEKLYAELHIAQQRVNAALRTWGRPLEGELLEKLVAAERKESSIRKRIKEILGA